jgi:hypothetical protein
MVKRTSGSVPSSVIAASVRPTATRDAERHTRRPAAGPRTQNAGGGKAQGHRLQLPIQREAQSRGVSDQHRTIGDLGDGALNQLAMVDSALDVVVTSVGACTADVALGLIERLERLAARLRGLAIRAQVRLTALRPAQPDDKPFTRYVDDEIATLLGQSPRAVAGNLATYWDIAERLPAALGALTAGELDYPRLQALARATLPLPAEKSTEIEREMLDGGRLASPSAWRRKATRLVDRVDPEAAARRHDRARSERTVSVRPSADAPARLATDRSAEDARAIMDREDRIARTEANVEDDLRGIGAKSGDCAAVG